MTPEYVAFPQNDHDRFTYRRIRKAIGILGVSLPLILIGFSFVSFFETKIQPSISHYYYSNLREIFTGTLCAVGLFLIRYRGHGNSSFWKNDNLLTNMAGLMAFCVALLPTNPLDGQQKIYSLIPVPAEWLGWLHYACAALLLLIFANLSINVFTIGQAQNKDLPVSLFNENNIYRTCGFAILVFIALVPISARFELFEYSTLIFEALSLFAFGIAWLIKGRILGDAGKLGEVLYREHHPERSDAPSESKLQATI